MKKRYIVGIVTLAAALLINRGMEEYRIPKGIHVVAKLKSLDDYTCEYTYIATGEETLRGVAKNNCRLLAIGLSNTAAKNTKVKVLITVDGVTSYDARLHTDSGIKGRG